MVYNLVIDMFLYECYKLRIIIESLGTQIYCLNYNELNPDNLVIRNFFKFLLELYYNKCTRSNFKLTVVEKRVNIS